jgi:hypothetical protein
MANSVDDSLTPKNVFELDDRRLLRIFVDWTVAGSVNAPGFVAVVRFFYHVDPQSVNMARIIRRLEANPDYQAVLAMISEADPLTKSAPCHA